MITHDIRFSGKEAEDISLETLRFAFKDVVEAINVPLVDHFLHNATEEVFKRLFPKLDRMPEDHMTNTFHGLSIFKRPYVPLDEFWMMDKDGVVLKKFKLK